MNGLSGKLSTWAKDSTGNIGLGAGLSRQKGHVALFVYDVDLTNASASEAWADLVGGTVSQALAQKGFTLDTGSGVSDSLTRAATLKFQFFNLFAFNSTEEFFDNSYSELGADGSIHILHDIGKETDSDTNKALKKFRIYFEADANLQTDGSVSNTDVDLSFEMFEQANWKYAASIAEIVTFLPIGAETTAAESNISGFLKEKPTGTLDMKITLKSTGYKKLSCSPFVGKEPPQNQYQDSLNWTAFRMAAEGLEISPSFNESPTYQLWEKFNVNCWDEAGSAKTADRHQGGVGNGIDDLLSPYGVPGLVRFFLDTSQDFMNLCDDLHTLAVGLSNIKTEMQWERTLKMLKSIMASTDSSGYAIAILGALISICGGAGAKAMVATSDSKDSLICLVTLA